MKNENKTFKNIVRGTFVAGALFSAAALSATNTSSLFDYDVLGSGAEVRTELLHSEGSPLANLDANCGEKAATTAKATKATAETKATEAKCGEGKCGEGTKEKATEKTTEKAAEAKAEVKKTAKAAESKAKEAKCGEGKCGK